MIHRKTSLKFFIHRLLYIYTTIFYQRGYLFKIPSTENNTLETLIFLQPNELYKPQTGLAWPSKTYCQLRYVFLRWGILL